MNEWLKKYLNQLIGGTFVEVLEDDEFYGFLIKMPDGKFKTLWVLRDPEGNGPGHADIQDVRTEE